jgi:hypothetical protein
VFVFQAELLLRVHPNDEPIRQLYSQVYAHRSAQAVSVMAKGIYNNAAVTNALAAKL